MVGEGKELHCVVTMCVSYEIWYGRYAMIYYFKSHYLFSTLDILNWRILEAVLWNDGDTITHNSLHILVTSGHTLILKFLMWDNEDTVTHNLLLMQDNLIVLNDAMWLGEGNIR